MGGGGAKGMLPPLSNYLGGGGGAGPPLPTPMNGSSDMHDRTEETQIRLLSEVHSSQGLCVWF